MTEAERKQIIALVQREVVLPLAVRNPLLLPYVWRKQPKPWVQSRRK